MGVNMAGKCIVDDEACKEASNQEIIRRYFKALCASINSPAAKEEVYKLELLLNQAGISETDRKCVEAARKVEKRTSAPAAAIELNNGELITGKTSELLGCSSAMLLNALKVLAGIDDETFLILPEVIKPVQQLKVNYLGNHNPRLHTGETLLALSISAATDKNAAAALAQLKNLKNTEMHSTVILSPVDESTLKKLGVRITCDAKTKKQKIK